MTVGSGSGEQNKLRSQWHLSNIKPQVDFSRYHSEANSVHILMNLSGFSVSKNRQIRTY